MASFIDDIIVRTEEEKEHNEVVEEVMKRLAQNDLYVKPEKYKSKIRKIVLQISYSLVVILELSGVLEIQYKEIMMSSINKNN